MAFMLRKLERDIRAWLANDASHPLLMRGARRTGKTTLVEAVGRGRAGEHFAKLDFQTDMARTDAIFSGATDDIGRITSNIAEYLRCDLDRERSILFFDEAQLNGKALNSLRFFSESGWRVIATGSLLGVSVNVQARSLRKLVEEGRAPRAYRLSEQNFSGSVIEGTGCMLAGLPLYAAFTLGS